MLRKKSKLHYNLRKFFILPFKILRVSIIDTVRQDGVEHAGYLAFLSILSLFPFLIFLISIVGFAQGIEAVQTILSSAPKEVTNALTPRVNEIISGPPQTFLTLAIIGVIWTASSSVEGCRTILNRAYRIHHPPPYIWRRLLSILEFFVVILLILAGIGLLVLAPIALRWLEDLFSISFKVDYDLFYIRHIIMFTILILSTSLLYYALPNAKQKITQTIPGSILSVILWFALERVFSLYLANFHQFNFVYGSLAGIIISLMFFYLISLIFIVGAEFNYHFHRTYQVFLKKKP